MDKSFVVSSLGVIPFMISMSEASEVVDNTCSVLVIVALAGQIPLITNVWPFLLSRDSTSNDQATLMRFNSDGSHMSSISTPDDPDAPDDRALIIQRLDPCTQLQTRCMCALGVVISVEIYVEMRILSNFCEHNSKLVMEVYGTFGLYWFIFVCRVAFTKLRFPARNAMANVQLPLYGVR